MSLDNYVIVVSSQVSTLNHLQNIKRIAQEFIKKGFAFNIHKIKIPTLKIWFT